MMAGAARRRAAQGGGETVTLTSNSNVSDFALSPNDAIAGIYLRVDGTVDRLANGSTTQINSGSDWLIPNRTIGVGEYWARCTNNGAGFHAGSDATGSWLDMSTQRDWFVEETGLGSNTVNFTVEISNDSSGTPVLDSATYTGNVDVEP